MKKMMMYLKMIMNDVVDFFLHLWNQIVLVEMKLKYLNHLNHLVNLMLYKMMVEHILRVIQLIVVQLIC